MKPLHLYTKSVTWQRKVILIAMYHNYECTRNRYHKVKDTAAYFHISVGLASENINLFKEWDKVKDCKTRKEALELII